MYRIEAVSAVRKDIRKLPRSVVESLETEHFPALKRTPRSGEPLYQDLKGLWSYHFVKSRTQYRIIYEIDDDAQVLYILLIGPRENLYARVRRRRR